MNERNRKVVRAARKVVGTTPQGYVSSATIGLGLLAVIYALIQGKLFTAVFGLLAILLGITSRAMAGNTKAEAELQRAHLRGYYERGREVYGEIRAEEELGSKV